MKIGFGTWRFFLAVMVAISHLWRGMIDGPAAYAVWGFFVLSGFLMTLILSERYGIQAEGLKKFAFNRFLRIFPLYWVGCVLGAVSLHYLPGLGVTPSALNPQFLPPQNAGDWFNNLTLLPLTGGSGLFVPVSGALAVEVAAYLLMPLMTASRAAAWLGLILSFFLSLKYGLTIETFGLRYSSFLTCFAVFALGALVCHYRSALARFSSPLFSVLAWLLQCIIWLRYDQWPWTYGLYVSALLSAWVVISLVNQKTGTLDRILGDLSYPVYLFHTTVAVWVMAFGFPDRTFLFFLVSFILTLLLSWALLVWVDRPLHRLKKSAA